MAIQERASRAESDAERRAEGEMQPIGDDLKHARSEVRSLGAAVGGIAQELRVLLVKEADLAQAEMADSRSAATRASMFGGVAAVAGILVLGFLALAMMFAFDIFMPQWLAALSTAGVLGLIALLAALIARRSLRDFTLTPKRTMRSIREDMKWAREQISRNGT